MMQIKIILKLCSCVLRLLLLFTLKPMPITSYNHEIYAKWFWYTGISLTGVQWEALKGHIDDIDRELKDD